MCRFQFFESQRQEYTSSDDFLFEYKINIQFLGKFLLKSERKIPVLEEKNAYQTNSHEIVTL